jgi:hypothetical protein
MVGMRRHFFSRHNHHALRRARSEGALYSAAVVGNSRSCGSPMSQPWTRGFTSGLHHVVTGEIGLEEGAEMDVGRSYLGAKGERVWWAPPVGAVFRRCELMKLGSFHLHPTVEEGATGQHQL